MSKFEFRLRIPPLDELERQDDSSNSEGRSGSRLSKLLLGTLVLAIAASGFVENPRIPIDAQEITLTTRSGSEVTRESSFTVTGTVKDLNLKTITLYVNGSPSSTPVVDGNFERTIPAIRGTYLVQAVSPKFASAPIRVTSLGPQAATSRVGPLDVVVVFDTTSSMQGAIDSMRASTVELVNELQKKSTDLRLGLVSFKDHAETPEQQVVETSPLTSDISHQFEVMNKWQPQGGGDTPEDQLLGIKTAIQMSWRNTGRFGAKVTKIIIVVTDAGAHSPDKNNDTFETIAKMAYDLDPAHIYPIIVGESPQALEDARKIASLTGGKVTLATETPQLQDKLLESIDIAIVEHSPASSGNWLSLTLLLLVLATIFSTVFLIGRKLEPILK